MPKTEGLRVPSRPVQALIPPLELESDMTTWILIITLAGYSSQSGQAIHSIPGFSTSAECIAAGEAWRKSVATAETQGHRPAAIACVAQRR